MNEYRKHFIYITFTLDDGGYYAEVSNPKGETIHATDIFNTHYRAEHAARKFVDQLVS